MPNYLDYQTNWPGTDNKIRMKWQRMVREYPKLYPERYKNAKTYEDRWNITKEIYEEGAEERDRKAREENEKNLGIGIAIAIGGMVLTWLVCIYIGVFWTLLALFGTVIMLVWI